MIYNQHILLDQNMMYSVKKDGNILFNIIKYKKPIIKLKNKNN